MSAHHSANAKVNGVTSFGEWNGSGFLAVSRTVAGSGTVQVAVRDDGLGDWVVIGELADGIQSFEVPQWIETGLIVSGASNDLDIRVCIYSRNLS